MVKRGLILKHLDAGLLQKETARLLSVDLKTVYNTKTKFLEHGLAAALYNEQKPGRPIEIDERVRCQIAAFVCSKPPEGFDRWTLNLLTETLSDKENIKISRESVRLVLKDHDLKPWQQKMWCIPEVNEQFISRMEDVLDVYERPYDETKPVICLDEKPVHLVDDIREPIEAKSGSAKKVDYEYERNGQASIFLAIEPKAGEFTTDTSQTRAGKDFASFMKMISEKYSSAIKIVLVMDNLNTHSLNSMIKAYGTEEGKAIWERFEVHNTPVHASWLNQAEIAISIMSRQCLGKSRVSEVNRLAGKVTAWTKKINEKKIKINWKFTKEKARKVFKLES